MTESARFLLTVFVVLTQSPVFAEWSLPGRDSLSVRSETTLSGVDLRYDEMKQVIERLGEPDSVVVRDRTEVSVTRLYEW